jgi:hypothetical protein
MIYYCFGGFNWNWGEEVEAEFCGSGKSPFII